MGKSSVFCLGLFSVFSVGEIQSMPSTLSSQQWELVSQGVRDYVSLDRVLEILKEHKSEIPMDTRNCDHYQRLINLAKQNQDVLLLILNIFGDLSSSDAE